MCNTDKRPQIYIDKLLAATEYKMTKDEFTLYLRQISRSEVRGNTIVEERRRVPRNEIKALLGAKKVMEAAMIKPARSMRSKNAKSEARTKAKVL